VPAYPRVVEGRLGREVERVIVVGRPTLSRPVLNLATTDEAELIIVHSGAGPWFDPAGRARLVASELTPAGAASAAERTWWEAWQAAGWAAWSAEAGEPGQGPVTGLEAAWLVASSCTELGCALVVGASNAVRYLDSTPPPPEPLRVFASRGAAGIDGTVSTAGGIAGGLGAPVRVLLGDLAFLHDAGALAFGECETPPDLDVIVLNDHGGGIFRRLDHAHAAAPAVFARYFVTPQHADLGRLASAYAARYVCAKTPAQLRRTLADRPAGVRVVEVPLGSQPDPADQV
jgi:2-succinyl-5-enolpyruvyl-6-hydroxy-3-cyclohexene-1-carboxylate synthase